MRVGVLFVIAACGADHKVPAPPVMAKPIARPVVAAPVTVAGMRFDRAPKPLGLGTRYQVPEAQDLVFCPGDRELVVLSAGKLRWVSAEHGRILREVEVPSTAEDPDASTTPTIDCRADGAALTTAGGDAVLVPHDGAPIRVAGAVIAARFAADGTIRTLSDDSYGKWTGQGAIETIVKPGAGARLGDGGALVHAHDGAFWLRRDAKETRIAAQTTTGSSGPRAIREFTGSVSISADGAIVGYDDNGETFAWIKGKHVKLASSIVGVPALAATKWFVMNYRGQLWVFDRPSIQSTHLEAPCGDFSSEELGNQMSAIAVSRDGERVAVSCGPVVGIRIFRIATLGVIAGRIPLPIVAAQWNGDRLATRDITGLLQIWQDGRHDNHAMPIASRGLAWWGDDVIVNDENGTSQRYSLTSRQGKPLGFVGAPGGQQVPLGYEILESARARELALHVTFASEILVQRGDTFTKLPHPDSRTLIDVAVSPDGARGLVTIAAGNSEPPTKEVATVDLAASTVKVTRLTATAIAASDQHLVIARGAELAYVVGDQATKLVTTDKEITALAYSPDGRVLAVGSADGSVAFYAGDKLIVRTPAHGSPVQLLAWGPELVSVANDQVLRWSFTP